MISPHEFTAFIKEIVFVGQLAIGLKGAINVKMI